jgi:hypothetical protein
MSCDSSSSQAVWLAVFLRILKRGEKIQLQLLLGFLSRTVSVVTFSVGSDGKSVIKVFYSRGRGTFLRAGSRSRVSKTAGGYESDNQEEQAWELRFRG